MVEKIQTKKFLIRPIKHVEAIQFDGKNGKKIADFINECAYDGMATSRGSWIQINEDPGRIRKTDWVVVIRINNDLVFMVMNNESFIDRYDIYGDYEKSSRSSRKATPKSAASHVSKTNG